MYDVQHGAEAAKNDAYKDNRLKHEDWAINEQSAAVLAPSAHATKALEGTTYVTISLVLPYIYRLIACSSDGMLHLLWKPAGHSGGFMQVRSSPRSVQRASSYTTI